MPPPSTSSSKASETSSKASESRSRKNANGQPKNADCARKEKRRSKRELKQARRMQRLFAVIAAVFLLLLVLAYVFYRRAVVARADAQRNLHEAKARELVAYATDSLNEDRLRSMVLAM